MGSLNIYGGQTIIVGDGNTIQFLDRYSSLQVEAHNTNDHVGISVEESQESDLIGNITNGYVLIINNYSSLYPSDFTSENFEVLQDFGLDPVILRKDLNTAEMFEVLKETSEKDFTEFDCFICAIAASYSTSDEMIMGHEDEEAIHIDILLDFFLTVPSLKNKPKVFLIQTIQVPRPNDSICTPSATNAGAKGTSVEIQTAKKPQRNLLSPADSNLLVCQATLPLCEPVATENSFCGLLKFVVDVFQSHADKEHIMDMITRVNSQITQSASNIKVRCLHACSKKFYFLRPWQHRK
ncbi:uncharacterized protein LOC110235680 [Exaiptasia diaphana]|uniref:Peptidase C14A caspase catalytic domain-containing protein n=1 Tax=Exaiptasia diaphana TaxID=2652724 RepID=A0A913X071_EXADI|nr:uncharacterized protein LOC110235680 [Exaiptasia diaphana]KXJ29968.1 Caspase-7 [Exaiptasia diaphana]